MPRLRFKVSGQKLWWVHGSVRGRVLQSGGKWHYLGVVDVYCIGEDALAARDLVRRVVREDLRDENYNGMRFDPTVVPSDLPVIVRGN